MHDDLVKRLRNCVSDTVEDCAGCPYQGGYKGTYCMNGLITEAADAIEELSKPKWILFETRPMDEEERKYYSEQYGFALADDEAVIYCSQMPDHGQEVLVCNEYGQVCIDTFDDDPDYGVGFETNGDMDGLVAWMPLPKPYEPPKEE